MGTSYLLDISTSEPGRLKPESIDADEVASVCAATVQHNLIPGARR